MHLKLAGQGRGGLSLHRPRYGLQIDANRVEEVVTGTLILLDVLSPIMSAVFGFLLVQRKQVTYLSHGDNYLCKTRGGFQSWYVHRSVRDRFQDIER